MRTVLAAWPVFLLAVAGPTLDAQAADHEGVAMRLPQVTASDLQAVSWAPDGTMAWIVGGREDERRSVATVLWTDGRDVRAAHDGEVAGAVDPSLLAVAWHPSGGHAIAVGAWNAILRLEPRGPHGVRIENLWAASEFASQTFVGRDAAWRPQGDYALLLGNGLLKWDGRNFTVLDSGNQVRFNAIGWHPSGRYALLDTIRTEPDGSLSHGRILRFEHVPREGCRSPCFTFEGNFSNEASSAFAISFSPRGDRAVLGGFNHTPVTDGSAALGRFVAYDGQSLSPLPFAVGRDVRGLAWRPDGSGFLAAVNGPPTLVFSDGEGVGPLWDRGHRAFGVAWRPQGDVALAVGRDGLVLRHAPVASPTITIDEPQAGTVLAASAWAHGLATSPSFVHPVDRVLVRLDGGAWQEAALEFITATQSAARWRFLLDPARLSPGEHRLEAVVHSGENVSEPAARLFAVPDRSVDAPAAGLILAAMASAAWARRR
ncbi:MAG TPA: hypothetical protein VM681_06620 [Candidatus Thermoplasmatota archaeon]|nr:hypothetical protein [Candidatus Thermoplasmatota archaeon]